MAAMEALLVRYQAPLRLVNLRFTNARLAQARSEMVRWSLDAGDAIHLAVAKTAATAVGVAPHIVTNDHDFEKVGDLHLWCRPCR